MKPIPHSYFAAAFITMALFFTIGVPSSVYAADSSVSAAANPHAGSADTYQGLVRCSGVVVNTGEVECNFSTIVSSISYLINWAFGISIPIAVALYVWAGFLYITGIQKNIDKAKGIFLNTSKGFIIMLVAFTIVHTLVSWLVNPATTTDPTKLSVTAAESMLQTGQ